MESYNYTIKYDIDGLKGEITKINKARDIPERLFAVVPAARHYCAKFSGINRASLIDNAMELYVWAKNYPHDFEVIDVCDRVRGHIWLKREKDKHRANFQPYRYTAQYIAGTEMTLFKDRSILNLAKHIEKAFPIVKTTPCIRYYGSIIEQKRLYSLKSISMALKSIWRKSFPEDYIEIISKDYGIQINIRREKTNKN